MADDIVTRLRERQRELELFWPDEDPPKTWVGEAADFIEAQQAEIERLRAAIDALHQPYYDSDPDSFTIGELFCICGSYDPWPCPTARLLHPEEARRG